MSSSGNRPLRTLFDPETVPHDPSFGDIAARGLAVDATRLQPDLLRKRFAQPPAWQPELHADPRLFTLTLEPRPAAVLVPLIVRGDDVQVLLTERTAHLNDHAGQISFPGGRVEEHDANPIATALRETEEEIGLGAGLVDIIGALPEYTTVTGYRVTPVVGRWRDANLLCNAVSGGSPLLHLGCDRGDAAQPLPLPARLNSGTGRLYNGWRGESNWPGCRW
jgi:8-oxo-dGTP pyrophosphatase MutT (NUDIX family)